MSYTVGDVLAESQALLNDALGTLFTTTLLLPYFKKSYDELRDLLELADVPVIWEATSAQSVAIGITTFTMPADFFNPIELHEKDNGTPDNNYSLMQRVMWLPDAVSGPSLTWWEYREQAINWVAATSIRQVRLRYYKALPTITVVGDVVTVNNAKTYLASRTASLAAFGIGENETRAKVFNDDAYMALDRIKRMAVKNGQQNRTRRRPFTIPRGFYW